MPATGAANGKLHSWPSLALLAHSRVPKLTSVPSTVAATVLHPLLCCSMSSPRNVTASEYVYVAPTPGEFGTAWLE